MFIETPLKELLKKVNLSQEKCEMKKNKKTRMLEKFMTTYKGEFQDDKRHGWGFNMFRNGDTYKGQYNRGIMDGRGIYFFNSVENNSVQYVGEMKENSF